MKTRYDAVVPNGSVIFIGGAGHSGSTLLGLILSTLPDALYLGEAKKSRLLGDLNKPAHKRTCKRCGPSCPVWGPIEARLKTDSAASVHLLAAEESSAQFVIDSTKDSLWQKESAERLGASATAMLILLERNGRAVVNSRRRKYPQVALSQHIGEWMEHMTAAEGFFSAFNGLKARVRYETLCLDPDAELDRLTAALSISHRLSANNFTSRANAHPLGGNAGTQSLMGMSRTGKVQNDYYQNHPGGLVLDERYKSELTRADMDLFDAMIAPIKGRFSWAD